MEKLGVAGGASAVTIGATSSARRDPSTGSLRVIPLLQLNEAMACSAAENGFR
jgi:hypothetical protein